MQTNASVTIFNIEKLQTGVRLHKTILPDVFFNEDKARILRKAPYMTDENAMILIGHDVRTGRKKYIPPDEFRKTECDLEKKWTLAVDDRVVRGEVKENYDTLAALDKAQKTFTITSAVFKDIGSKNMWRWEVYCK